MQPESVAAQVEVAYGLRLTLTEVAGGADSAATLWRGVTADGDAYAVKVSRGQLAAGLAVTARLAAAGVTGVPAPVTTVDGERWTALAGAQLSVVPWLDGRPAVGRLDPAGWRAFGALLAGVHGAEPPAGLPVEDYRPASASTVRRIAERLRTAPADAGAARPPATADAAHPPAADAAADAAGRPVKDAALDETARELIAAWRGAAEGIEALPDAAEALGARLRERPAELVLCHGDAHAYNLLLGESGDAGELWLVDWDGAVLAPRERDLMFVVDGVLADDLVTPEQQRHFFAGYGGTVIDPTRLAYYRCAWALDDLGGFAAEILEDPTRTAAQRQQALRYFRSVLTPSGIVRLAEQALRELS